MAAKTTSGSGFDRIFRLFGPSFLLESEGGRCPGGGCPGTEVRPQGT